MDITGYQVSNKNCKFYFFSLPSSSSSLTATPPLSRRGRVWQSLLYEGSHQTTQTLTFSLLSARSRIFLIEHGDHWACWIDMCLHQMDKQRFRWWCCRCTGTTPTLAPPALEQACLLTSTHPILTCHLCWDPHPSSLQKAPPEEGVPLFPLRDPLTIHLALHIPTTAMVLLATTTAPLLGEWYPICRKRKSFRSFYKVLNSYWPFPGLMETVGWRRANAANCPTLKPWNICWESPAHLFISPPFDVVPNIDWWRFVLSVVTLWVELGSHPLQNTIAIDGIKSFVVSMGRFLLRMMPKTSLATMSFYCCDKHVSLMFSVPSVNFHYRSIWLQDSFS